MRKTIWLAAKGKPSPNPKVGAVLVRNGRVVGSGYHRRSGYPHAEAIAIKDAGSKVRGATLYTNLEPCCHYGQTPPCSVQIIKAGIKRVVIGMVDPNPVVSCRGIDQLREAGIETELAIEEERCQALNRGYLKKIRTGLPYTIIKIASSLDGRIASMNGTSTWITGIEARRYTHFLRSQVDAIVVGVGTVIRDDSQLTVRHTVGLNPARIVIDPNLKTPDNARILSREAPTYILTSEAGSSEDNRIVHLADFQPISILKKIAKMGFNEIIVEGGGKIFSAMIESRLFDELIIVYAPKIIGQGISFTQFRIQDFASVLNLDIVEVRRFKDDIMIRGRNVQRDSS